jgi:cellulase/cellobiase CelA1
MGATRLQGQGRKEGTVARTRWTLRWTFSGDREISDLWNGSYSQSGSTVTVNSLNYNGTIPAGGSYGGMGFTADFSGTNTPRQVFR